MKTRCLRLSADLAVAQAAFLLLAATAVVAATSGEVRKLFAEPPREYATAPLWVWNNQLTEQQVRETMRDLAGEQVLSAPAATLARSSFRAGASGAAAK